MTREKIKLILLKLDKKAVLISYCFDNYFLEITF